MSRALKLALDFAATGKQPPESARKGMGPQELAFFFDLLGDLTTASMDSTMPNPRQLEQWADRAKMIDSGGAELSDQELIESHKSGLHQYASGQQANFNMLTPGVDDVAAKHVCTADISTLKSVCAHELEKGRVNKRKILWVTTVQPCFRIWGVQLLVKDESGKLMTVGLYNFIQSDSTSADAQATFPVGTRLGIREPYYKCLNSGAFGIRVDNPCNVIIDSSRIGNECKSPDQLKREGNDCFTKKRYKEANRLYSDALDKATDPTVRLPLLLNRAAARLGYRDYTGALIDCDAAIAIDASSVKGRYRCGQALFGLRRYADAVAAFVHLIDDEQGLGHTVDKAWTEQLAKTKAALVASTTGVYDLLTFPFNPLKQEPTDVAEYYGPVEVRRSAGKGRGLFLTQDVVAGQLLLVESPIAYCIDEVTNFVTAISYEDNTINTGSLHGLVSDVILLANTDPLTNSKLAYLSTGQETDKSSMPILDINTLRPGGRGLPNMPQVTAYAVKHIVKVNAFGFNFSGKDPSKEAREAIAHAMKNPIANDVTKKPRTITPPEGSILIEAIVSGMLNADTMKAMMMKGVISLSEINKADAIGHIPLHFAVLSGKLTAVQALLANGASVAAKEELGLTPLHYAVGEYYNLAIATALIDSGAPVNAMSKRGFTPIYGAVVKDRLDAVKLLLKHGADPYIENYAEGGSAADLAREHGSIEMKRTFERSGYSLDVLRHGSGVWLVSSFMNHAKIHNSMRRFIGKMMFVYAGRDMKKGMEVTTTYGGEDKLKHWKI